MYMYTVHRNPPFPVFRYTKKCVPFSKDGYHLECKVIYDTLCSEDSPPGVPACRQVPRQSCRKVPRPKCVRMKENECRREKAC